MRQIFEINAEEAILRGWLYPAARTRERAAAVMAHGFPAVKEIYLDRFAAAGLAVTAENPLESAAWPIAYSREWFMRHLNA